MAKSEFPESYKDPVYASLDAKTEEKLGLPSGLLSSVRTNGERSNHSATNDLGTFSAYQFIPATRKAILDKYGLDVTLSPENASEGAGLLLKEGLQRNKGDPALAVAEYVGGLDRSKWGPVTKSYVARVAGGLPVAAPAPVAQGQSSYDKIMASMSKPDESSMASVYGAYQSGQMSPEDAKAFESEVNAGRVMLPRGASLKTEATGAPPMPDGLAQAYMNGQMAPADRAQLDDLIKQGVIAAPKGASQIPGQTEGAPSNVAQTQPDPTIGQSIVGAGEAGLNIATGLTGGTVGAIGGAAKGFVDAVTNPQPGVSSMQQMSNAAEQGAQALTYAPRTAQGQSQAQVAGNVLANAVPLAGLSGELASAGQAAAALKPTVAAIPPVVRNAVGTAATNVAEGVKAIPERVMQMAGREPAAATPTPGTMGSAGAMGVDMATQRRMAAQDLPNPIDLTRGQAERSFEQQRFEQETAKNPTLGAPLREKFADQNQQVLRNFDAWVDQTGAEAPDLRATGVAVDKALVSKAARDKAEIRVAYKNAEKAGEMAQPVNASAVADVLNSSRSAESTAPVLTAAKAEIQRLGGASLDDAGNLVGSDMTLGNMEQLRKFVNKVQGIDPTNQKFAGDLKRAIDESTVDAGGDLYRSARRLRENFANQYENRAVIAKMLNTKRGTNDRQVAFEDMFDHSILRGSLDDVRTVRKVLQTGGDDGKQAWRELQGQTVNYIRDQATKNVARDVRGNQIVSAAGLDKAIRSLDSDGKLDFVFGKKGAEQLRAINDLAKVIYTAPPGSVNTSNTASVLLAALDMATSGAAGMPLPVMSGLRMVVNNVKDRRIKARVTDAISPNKAPGRRTIH